tara:strand:- start:1332 stop:1742 length:411 start_codon:yes stop_codon:yes gene_type:complete
MVAINNATIRQNVYETIYDLLNNNIGSYNSSTQPTITAAYIDDTKSMPEIVVHPVDVDESDYSFGQATGSKEVRVMIEVYTTKNKDVDLLTDDVDVLLNSSITGLNLVGRAESTAFETPNNNKLHLKTITYTFMRR